MTQATLLLLEQGGEFSLLHRGDPYNRAATFFGFSSLFWACSPQTGCTAPHTNQYVFYAIKHLYVTFYSDCRSYCWLFPNFTVIYKDPSVEVLHSVARIIKINDPLCSPCFEHFIFQKVITTRSWSFTLHRSGSDTLEYVCAHLYKSRWEMSV